MEENQNYDFPAFTFVLTAMMFAPYTYMLVAVSSGMRYNNPIVVFVFGTLIMYLVIVYAHYVSLKNKKIDSSRMRFAIIGGFIFLLILHFFGCISIL